MRFEFTNIKDLDVTKLDPEKLYTTQVVTADWVDGIFVVKLKFIGEIYDRNDIERNCLFPVTQDLNPEPSYSF